MKVAAILLIGSATLIAQQPAATTGTAPVAFEAATVKPTAEGPHHSGTHTRTGMLIIQGQNLQTLIRSAYHLMPNQVEGGPKWSETERYDINAKSEGPAEDAALMLMLRTLLADRFQLKFHLEQKEFSGYALVAAKGGLKIHPVENASGSSNSDSRDRRTTVQFDGATLAKLADVLTRSLGEPVVDETGAAGAYSFKLEWSPQDLNARGANADALAADSGPTVFTALQELGLKLEPRKVHADVYVIDSASKPGEN